jgi:2'-5' RNA ligase
VETSRLFVAIPLGGEINRRLTDLQALLKSDRLKVRWTLPEKLHLTLHFLGQTPANLLEDLQHDLGACGDRHHPFDLPFTSLGFFPNQDQPRIIWIGLRDTHGRLAALVDDTRRILQRARLFKLRDDFVPHITLGRVEDASQDWDSRALKALMPAWHEVGPGPLGVDRFDLFQSLPTSGGTVYKIVKEFPLKG